MTKTETNGALNENSEAIVAKMVESKKLSKPMRQALTSLEIIDKKSGGGLNRREIAKDVEKREKITLSKGMLANEALTYHALERMGYVKTKTVHPGKADPDAPTYTFLVITASGKKALAKAAVAEKE